LSIRGASRQGVRVRDAVRGWLSREERLGPRLALVAVLLCLPALWVGWQLDDHYQRLALTEDAQASLAPARIFATLTGDPETQRSYLDRGLLPWWTAPGLRLAFMRELSVLTAWFDYRAWPASPLLMHAHSLAWLAALVAAAAALYRSLMGPGWLAGLAALLYAVDDAHAVPAAWLANRSALIATCFGILCLVAHHRWRRQGSRRAAVAAPILLALALGSAETGLGIVGYLVAHAWFLDRGSLGQRGLALLPATGVLLVWAVSYRALGYGTDGSGVYVDPVADPLRFLAALATRGPLLLMGQWWPIHARAGNLPEPFSGLVAWAAVGLALVAGLVLASLVARRRLARFWCTGMLLALVPAAAVFPDDRLLTCVGIGGMGLLALFLGEVSASSRPLVRAVAAVWLVTHLILAPLGTPFVAYAVKRVGERSLLAVDSVPTDPRLAGQDLILVNTPDYLLYVTQIPTVKRLRGAPVPRRVRALTAGAVATELHRLDERTLRVRAEGGLFSGTLGRLFRGPGHPLAPGDRVSLPDVEIEIEAATADGRPTEILFRFTLPLEDPSLRWMQWTDDRYLPFDPPPIGQRLSLPAPLDLFGTDLLIDRGRRRPTRSRLKRSGTLPWWCGDCESKEQRSASGRVRRRTAPPRTPVKVPVSRSRAEVRILVSAWPWTDLSGPLEFQRRFVPRSCRGAGAVPAARARLDRRQ